MAKTSRSTQRSAGTQKAQPNEPRRLGASQNRGASQGAQRRAARRAPRRTSRYGWLAIGLVVVVVVVFVIVKVTGGSNSPTSNAAGNVVAPASIVTPVTTVPASVFDAVGTGGQGAPFLLTSKQPVLMNGAKPVFFYVGGEYCPYCALMRWSLVSALARFGTFTGLRQTSSAVTDANIPTFSFAGSHYSSKYVDFQPFEILDRNQQPLQKMTKAASKAFSKYDAPPYTAANQAGGIPFLDIANQYIANGDPTAMYNMVPLVQNGGPGRQAIAQAIHDPNSSVGQAIQAKNWIVEDNYIAATICQMDGNKPASVCTSKGVLAAVPAIKALKPTA